MNLVIYRYAAEDDEIVAAVAGSSVKLELVLGFLERKHYELLRVLAPDDPLSLLVELGVTRLDYTLA